MNKIIYTIQCLKFNFGVKNLAILPHLKLKTIQVDLNVKLYCDKYGILNNAPGKSYNRDRSRVEEFLLQLENKQQNMPNNVESQHNRMNTCIRNILVYVK